MPQPNAARATEPHLLDITAPLPERTYALRVTVALGRSDQRVHGRVDADTPDGVVTVGTIRCGVRVWRGVLLPGMAALASVHHLPFSVREVANGPPARPSPLTTHSE